MFGKAHVLPRAMKHEPPSLQQLRVPKTIRMEWMRVERLFHDGETDTPKCTCPTCPYSAGGPLQNGEQVQPNRTSCRTGTLPVGTECEYDYVDQLLG